MGLAPLHPQKLRSEFEVYISNLKGESSVARKRVVYNK